jgi:hypothetical protein
MNNRAISLLLLLPVTAFAQANQGATADLQSMATEELCKLKDSAEALDELDRRELFSNREIRSIKMDKIRRYISEAALICMRGEPDEVVALNLRTRARDFIDSAFVYAPSEKERLVIFLRYDRLARVVDGSFTLDDRVSLANLELAIIQRAIIYQNSNSPSALGLGSLPSSRPTSQQIVEYDPQPF